jgi:hypothetical protein
VCAGIVSHAYLGHENDNEAAAPAIAYAEHVGLTCEAFAPAYSWYFPGSTTLHVFSCEETDELQMKALDAFCRAGGATRGLGQTYTCETRGDAGHCFDHHVPLHRKAQRRLHPRLGHRGPCVDDVGAQWPRLHVAWPTR